MTDNAERWFNFVQAAIWLAEGRDLEFYPRGNFGGWCPVEKCDALRPEYVYRLKPEPPKPREFQLCWDADLRSFYVMSSPGVYPSDIDRVIRVREVLE